MDETLPPTYEIAAADSAPTYWESTVFGTNSIADSDTAWSPDGSFVGDVDEMIIGTMTIGTIFAFVWNMVISGTFQFIGFVLTFLLHTTHAAKLGSRAGLGVSLIQYGLELLRNIDLAMKEALKKKQAASKSHSSDTISLPTQNALSHSKLICCLIVLFGLILLLHSLLTYIYMYKKSHSLVKQARRQEREQALQALPTENQPTSEQDNPLPRTIVEHLRDMDPLGSVRRAYDRWREAMMRDLNAFGPSDVEAMNETIPRPYLMGNRGMLLFSLNDALASRDLERPYSHPVTVTELQNSPFQGLPEESPTHRWQDVRFV